MQRKKKKKMKKKKTCEKLNGRKYLRKESSSTDTLKVAGKYELAFGFSIDSNTV